MADLAHRKASKKIQFIGKDGKPLSNQNIQVELKKHDFLFGCGAFDFVAAVSIPDEEKKAHFIDRTEKWAKLFNYGKAQSEAPPRGRRRDSQRSITRPAVRRGVMRKDFCTCTAPRPKLPD